MRASRNISILIFIFLATVPTFGADDGPDARELERRAALKAILNARPAPNPMPKKIYTPEQSASAEHRAIVSYEPGTKTMTVRPANEIDAVTNMKPYMGLFEELPGQLSSQMESSFLPNAPDPIYPLYEATEFPYRTIVKLVADYPHPDPDRRSNCSGVVVNPFHVITAGHCVYSWDVNDDGITGDRAWADEILVFPAQGDVVDPLHDPTDEDNEIDWPFGVARAVMYRSYSGWTDADDEPNYDHDWAVLTLDRPVGWYTGWMGLDILARVDLLNFSGYPTQPEYGFGNAVVQWFGWGETLDYSIHQIEIEGLSYGGHSGGPSWRYQDGGNWIQAVGSRSDRQGLRQDTRISPGKLGDLLAYIVEDTNLRPPIDRPDLQECLFRSWGCTKNLHTNVVTQGGQIRVDYNILNSGFAHSGDIEVEFYLSTDDLIEPWDTLIFSGTLDGLDPFMAYNGTVDLIVPTWVSAGDYFVGWAVSSTVPEYENWPLGDNEIVITDETLTVEEAHVVTITSPNGGELWYEGNTPTITWTSFGAGDFVSIELSRNGGATWETLSYVEENDGSFSWPVSGPFSDACRVRITPTSYPGASDVSDADFRILPSLVYIEVTSPNGGESWYTGHTFDVTWNSLLAGPTVSIEVSRSGGILWETIVPSTANDGHYAWPVTAPGASNCMIRVTSVGSPAVMDVSDAFFSIETLASSVFVTSPDGGETLPVGSTHDIRWNSVFLTGAVMIELSRSGGLVWEPIAPSTSNDGLYSWTVTGPTTNLARIRVSSVDTPFVSDTSDANFSILYSLSSILVSSPNGGETGYPGYPLDITWSTTYVTGDVMIELTRDGGASWETISAGTANDGLFTWPVTGPASGFCKVRITSLDDPVVNDVSDGYFSITFLLSNLFVTSPNGGEELHKARLFDITWNSSYLTGEVGIDISRDGGDTWETIVPNTPDDGIFNWVTTGAMSDECLIRVRSIDFPILSDTSDGTFAVSSLTPRLQMDEPNGGESWHDGVAHILRWSSALVTSDVAFDVSRDGGLTWETIIDATTNDGLQIWWVTGPESSNSRIRVRALDDPSVDDTSDEDFAIAPLYDARIREVRRMGGGQLELQWTDTDWEDSYGIYRGTLTTPFGYGHDTVLACGIPGGTTSWVTPDDQETGQPSYYYLIVPEFQSTRQFGVDSDGNDRPPATTTCP